MLSPFAKTPRAQGIAGGTILIGGRPPPIPPAFHHSIKVF